MLTLRCQASTISDCGASHAAFRLSARVVHAPVAPHPRPIRLHDCGAYRSRRLVLPTFPRPLVEVSTKPKCGHAGYLRRRQQLQDQAIHQERKEHTLSLATGSRALYGGKPIGERRPQKSDIKLNVVRCNFFSYCFFLRLHAPLVSLACGRHRRAGGRGQDVDGIEAHFPSPFTPSSSRYLHSLGCAAYALSLLGERICPMQVCPRAAQLNAHALNPVRTRARSRLDERVLRRVHTKSCCVY